MPALAATPAQTECLATRREDASFSSSTSLSLTSSAIETALVATANGLVRGDERKGEKRSNETENDDDDETETRRNRDVALDVSAAFAAPFAEPPKAGSVAVFGGSFVRCFSSSPSPSPRDEDDGERNAMDDDGSGSARDSPSLSFETDPIADTRPRDWLKLLQTVTTLDAHRRVFAEHSARKKTSGSFPETGEPRVNGSAEACSAGLWRAAIEIARRATRGLSRTGVGRAMKCVVTPERIARRSLTAALSRALRRRDAQTNNAYGARDEKKTKTPPEDQEDPLVFFSVLAFGARVEAQAVRRFEWDVVKRRRRRASRFGARRFGEAGRARTATAEPPTADADADETLVDVDFFDARFFPELEEDPEALVAETVDAVVAEARAELSETSEPPEPDRLLSGTAQATSSPAASFPAEASGGSRLVSSSKTQSPSASLFRGGDDCFLRHHPFGFLVELFARADAFEPGVFGGLGGTKKAEALARAVVFAATRRAVADVFVAAGEDRKRQTKKAVTRVSRDESLSIPIPTASLQVSFVKSRLERTAWQVDALLSILRGEPFSLPALFFRGNRAGDGKEDDVVDRLFLNLFSAPFAEVFASAVEDEGIRFGSDSDFFSNASRVSRETRDDVSNAREDFFFREDFIDGASVAPAFRRRALPRRHEDALARFADATCERCRLKPRDPAVCLACGAVMCCADASCVGDAVTRKGDARDAARDERALSLFDANEKEKEKDVPETRAPFFLYDFKSGRKTSAFPDAVVFEDVGACSAHASRRACGGGSCCFLLLKSTRILILHSGAQRACLFPSPYLDAHGEEDEHMRRGRPLFLSEARASFLEKLWACGALEHDSRATGASRLGGEWY